MSQDTVFGKADVKALIKLQKADGRTLYYQVVDQKNIEISEQEYKLQGGI